MLSINEHILGAGVRFSYTDAQGREIGRAFLYILHNNIHPEPFGLMEDVFVEEGSRGKGIGKKLVQKVIEAAQEAGCYKLIATSRHSREEVHGLYEGLGFEDHGKEFRIDF